MFLRVFLLVLTLVTVVPALAANQAPNFSLPGISGTVSLQKLQGQVIYVDFWASWCSPCRKSFPWMNDIANKYKDMGLTVIAINLDKERELAMEFLNNVPHGFTIAFDPEGEIASQYKVNAMPSSYLIDRNGDIHSIHYGFRDDKTSAIETNIKSLLKQ